MIAVDYVGLSTLVTSICVGLGTIIVAWKQAGTNRRVDDVHDAVKTSNGRTIGEIVEANDLGTR